MSNTAAVASPSTDPQDVNRVLTPRPPSDNDNAQNSINAPVIPPGNGTGNSTGNGTTGTPGNGTTTRTMSNKTIIKKHTFISIINLMSVIELDLSIVISSGSNNTSSLYFAMKTVCLRVGGT